jgi:hypothetical protein
MGENQCLEGAKGVKISTNTRHIPGNTRLKKKLSQTVHYMNVATYELASF